MATSSKRFIIIMVFLDILLGMAFLFAMGNTVPENQIGLYNDNFENVSGSLDNFHETNIDEGEEYLAQYGDSIAGWSAIGEMFKINLKNPDLDCPDCPDTRTANTLSNIIKLFYIIIHVLAGFEILMLVVNKKQD